MVNPEGSEVSAGRLPFQVRRVGDSQIRRLSLVGATVLGWVHLDRLELEIPGAELEGGAAVERYQRRRTQLAVAAVRLDQRAIDLRVAAAAPALALQGVTNLSVRLVDRGSARTPSGIGGTGTGRQRAETSRERSPEAMRAGDGHVAVTARVADGLAAADVSFRVMLAPSGLGVRVLAGDVRVHGHLPTPGPALAHRILATILTSGDTGGARDAADGMPHARGLCDIELQPLPALLWRLLPPNGWRLPAISGVELVAARISRAGLTVSYAPAGVRNPDEGGGDPATAAAMQLVVAHDAMHTADELLRRGQLDDAMRGYRALLAAGGPDQPVLLGRILAIAAARPPWFVDGLELARQALSRWPDYGPAHAALASIALAKGDARDAAHHLGLLAEACAEGGDDDAAALAALAAARLLRVLDPRGATALYETALLHHPGHGEAVDALAERYGEESRWHDLVRLHRARLAATTDRSRAVRDHLRLAEVLAQRLGDRRTARAELERARELAPDDAAVHGALADLAEASGDDDAAAAALGEVARLAREQRDQRAEAQAWARRAQLLDRTGDTGGADLAWTAALDACADDATVMRGAARARARRGDHAGASQLWRAIRAAIAGGEERRGEDAEAALELGRALVALGDAAGARTALDDAARGPAEIAADAHELLAELSRPAASEPDPQRAVAELDAAIAALISAAEQVFAAVRSGDVRSGDGDVRARRAGEGDTAAERMLGRAAVLSLERARILDASGDAPAAAEDLRRAHRLAAPRAPEVARDAARALLDRATEDAMAQREWVDALLATRPPEDERARLLLRRARLRMSESPAAPTAALDDLGESLAILDGQEDGAVGDAIRAEAHEIRATILAERGDRKGSAQALAARAKLSHARLDRVVAEADAAAAWLDADEPAAALPHASRATAGLGFEGELPVGISAELRDRVLETLGEAAWRQRAWQDVARATDALLEGGATGDKAATLRYRRAVASEKLGDPDRARQDLDSVLGDPTAPTDLRAHAHRLLADLCERAGDLSRAAASLEAFAGDPTTGISGAARADAWYRAAELYRKADQSGSGVHLESAARCLEGALRLVEDHLPALDALEMVERALGNLERVAVILGRKIAASARRPGRQKSLLARLAALQVELDRPEIALEAYRRALEIDPDYRPALRFVADQSLGRGERSEAATLYERLAGPLPGDGDEDSAAVAAARVAAAGALGATVAAACSGDAAEVVWAATWLARARSAVEIALELAPADAELLRVVELLSGTDGRVAPTAAAPSAAATRTRAAALQRQASEAREAGRLDIAAAHLAAAVALEPGDVEILRDHCEVLADRGEWAAQADALTRLAEMASDRGPGPRRADILLELADIAYDRLGDLDRARAAMRAAADAHGPSARRDATLRLLSAETFARGEFAEALAAYEAIAPGRRNATDLVAMATAHHRLGRDVNAIVMLEEARATGQLSAEGAMLLFALHTERTRKQELASALEHAARTAPPAEARARLLEALSLYRDHVRDPEAAERVQARIAAIEVPEAPEVVPVAPAVTRTTAGAADAAVAAYDASAAMAVARRAFAAPVALGPAAQAPRVDDDWQLPTAAAASGAAADAADLASTATATAAAPSRAEELERDAQAAAARGELRAAADLLADALAARVAAGASLAEALGCVGDLEAVAADAPDLVVRALFNAAARAPAPVAVALLRRAAVAAEKGLADDVITADALARAHSLSLDDPTILDELAVVLGRTGDVIRLADACERTARATTGRTAARAWYRLGVVHRDAFNDPRRSAEDFTAAHKADPDYPDVWLPLANAMVVDDDLHGARGLYERALFGGRLGADERRWVQERLDALGRDPDVVSGEIKKEEVLAAVAQTLTDMMTAMATGITEAVVDKFLAPETPTAEPQVEPEEAEAVPPLDPGALEEIYERHGDWDALTELLGKRIVETDDRRQKAALWYRRARLYRDILHREAETYRCLREAHACDPADADIAHALRAVAMARGEWALAAQLLYREIGAAGTTRDQGALHLELAMIFDEKLLEPESARVNYEQALALDPEIPAAPAPLAAIYELSARHADAALMWERAAALARADARAALLLRASAAAARIPDLAGARRLAGTAALAADAAGDSAIARDARNEVARLAPAAERSARALAVGAGDAAGDERVTGLETALVDAQARGDLASSDRHASSLLDVDPSNGLAFRHLSGNAETAGDWPMLTALLTARAMVIADPAERATLWFEIGRVHELHRADLAAAAAAYDRSLDADRDHPGALDARATLAFREQDWDRADALYGRIQPARSSLSRELILLRRVAVAEARGRLDEALSRAREAAAAEGASRDAFVAAVKLGVRLGDYGAAAVASRAALELISPDDSAALAEARLELADLLRMAGDNAAATDLYEQVITDDPRNLRALTAQAELLQQQGQHGAAARVLRTLASLADVPARKAELVWRLGEVHLRAGELLDADDAFLRASDLDPAHTPTLRRLIDVYWRADEPASLLDVANDLASHNQLLAPATDRRTLGRALVAAASSSAVHLAARVAAHLGAESAPLVAAALGEIGEAHTEITVETAGAGLRELAKKNQGPRIAAIVDAVADVPGIDEDRAELIGSALTG